MESQPRNPQHSSDAHKSTGQAVHAGEHRGVEPSGPNGDNPATAGPGPTHVNSDTPENKEGHLNPSAPEDSNITPGTAGTK